MSIHNGRTAIRILVVEDEPGVRNLVSLALKHQGHSGDFVEDSDEAISRLHEMPDRFAAILIDAAVGSRIREVVEEARAMHPPIPVIMLVDAGSAAAEQFGADRTIVKPLNGESLRNGIQNCLRRRGGMEDPAEDNGFMAGVDPALPSSIWRAELEAQVRPVAISDVPVLIRGETGAGKEVLARRLHALSPRSARPFLKVNCTALPSELIESELFGYERGAFTGAFKSTPGKFEMADGGVILLDEIGDMDFRLQAKLLQVLQDFEFIPLGCSEPRRVDVRVIAATHRDLERAIAERRFREDLYYRLNIVTLHVPALRDRRDEVLPLALHFMRKHATYYMPPVELTHDLRDALLAYDWPGNVRELENVIRKLLIIRNANAIAEELRSRVRRRVFTIPLSSRALPDLASYTQTPQRIEAGAQASNPPGPMQPMYLNSAHIRSDGEPAVSNAIKEPEQSSVLGCVDRARRQAETGVILAALNSTLWNRRRAAELLNVDYKALLYKMKKLGIVERGTTRAPI